VLHFFISTPNICNICWIIVSICPHIQLCYKGLRHLSFNIYTSMNLAHRKIANFTALQYFSRCLLSWARSQTGVNRGQTDGWWMDGGWRVALSSNTYRQYGPEHMVHKHTPHTENQTFFVVLYISQSLFTIYFCANSKQAQPIVNTSTYFTFLYLMTIMQFHDLTQIAIWYTCIIKFPFKRNGLPCREDAILIIILYVTLKY